ncbi:hypothetical protein [Paenibacillus zanthoxyli]
MIVEYMSYYNQIRFQNKHGDLSPV